MATLEKAEELEQRVMINAGEQSAQALIRLSGKATQEIVDGGWKFTKGRAAAFQRTLGDMADGIRDRSHEKKWGSEVTVKEFSDTVEGKREIVDVDDDELVGEVRQELRKHGVTFAVERDEEGQHYLHVRGNDASLIAHALERAQERLDGRRLNQEITELGQAAAWVEKQEAPPNDKRAELRNSADYLKASPEEQAEMSTQLESSLAADAQQRIDNNQRGQVPPKVLEAEERGLRGMDVAVELREQAQTLAREGTPPRGAERETPQQETGTPEREAPQREEAAPEQAPTADDLDAHEEAYLNERRESLDHNGADLPEGYVTEQTTPAVPGDVELGPKPLGQYDANLSPAEHMERGREIRDARAWALENDRDALRAYEHGDMGAEHPADSWKHENTLLSKYRGAVADGYKPSATRAEPKFTNSREQSKANIREKIAVLSDRLRNLAGTTAPTRTRGLDAHIEPQKGPRR